MLFDEYENVVVFDSKLAVGGIRFLVDEALKYQDESMEFVVEKLNQLDGRKTAFHYSDHFIYQRQSGSPLKETRNQAVYANRGGHDPDASRGLSERDFCV